MVSVKEGGAVILPAMPAFYHKPTTIKELVDYIVGKILDQLGIEHSLFEKWGIE
jgi:4-hydroxy-3-polyprenylbenzoate decarboxylase